MKEKKNEIHHKKLVVGKNAKKKKFASSMNLP